MKRLRKRTKKVIKIVVITAAVVFLAYWAAYYYMWADGTKVRFKDYELSYTLNSSGLMLRYEDNTLTRDVILDSKYREFADPAWQPVRIPIHHYRYDACEKNRTSADPGEFANYALSDTTTVRNFTYSLVSRELTESQQARAAVRMVQLLENTGREFRLGEDIPKFFLQTLYDLGGSSADKSIMLAAMLKYLGFKSVLAYDSRNMTMCAGVILSEDATCPYIEYNGEHYALADVRTYGCVIGDKDIDPSCFNVVAAMPDDGCTLRYCNDLTPMEPQAGDEGIVEKVKYSLKSLFLHPFASIEEQIGKEEYEYYSSLPRYESEGTLYGYYVKEEKNRETVRRIVNDLLEKYTDKGASEYKRFSVIASFVHNIPYKYDSELYGTENYGAYPVETLYNNAGDCEDHAILMAAMLRELGYKCALVYYAIPVKEAEKIYWLNESAKTGELTAHMLVAVQDKYGIFSGDYFDIDGEKYYLFETVSPHSKPGFVKGIYRNVQAEIELLQ
jgi:transglutaminase-like putative cysteine protease